MARNSKLHNNYLFINDKIDVSILCGSIILCVIFVVFSPNVSAARQSANDINKKEQFSQKIVEALNDYNENAFSELLDIEALGDRASRFGNTKNKKAFIKGVSNAKAQMISNIFYGLRQNKGHVVLMHTSTRKNTNLPLLRFNLNDEGFDYWELVVEKNSTGKYYLVDWYQLSRGQLVSTSVGAITRLLAAPDKSLLQKLFGNVDEQAALKTMGKMIDAIKKRQNDKAIRLIDEFPDKIKYSRVMCSLAVSLASMSDNEQLYRKVLSRLAKYHSDDPSAAFALIDHFTYQENYDAAITAIETLEQRVGSDGVTSMLKSSIRLLGNNYAAAKTFAETGIKLEPGFDTNYYTLALANIKLKDFKTAIKTYKLIKKKFSVQIDKEYFKDQEEYSDFIKSKEYAAWEI